MVARKTLAGVLATTVAGATLALTAAPASAAYVIDADDSKTANITAADLVGVGSDTSQHALKLLADAWNGGARTTYGQTFDVATFSALGGGHLPAPLTLDATGGEVVRPTGSGPGRNTLYDATRVSNVDFARSSSAPSEANFTRGQRAIPFAVDTVVVAVAGTNPVSGANPSLTLAQLRGIYQTCTIDSWNEVNPAYPNQPIEAFVPKQGSGTEAFFKTSVLPSGVTSYGDCVKDNVDGTPVQEHDAAIFAAKPNALVPFSKGRAELAGTVKVVAGGEATFKRNLYNVVRAEEANRADIQAFFGENGFVCSAAANPIIKAAGFDQLATAALGGVCGQVLNTSSSNFTLNTITTPSVAISGSGNAAGFNLTASLSSNPQAVGKVTFVEGATVLAKDVSIVSGRAVTTPLKLAAGAHAIKAIYTPGQSNFKGAESTATVTVAAAPAAKTKATITEGFPAKVKLAKKAKKVTVKGTVTVKGATGKVTVKKGKKTVATGTLKAGKAKVSLKNLKPGTHKLTISYAGDATHLEGTKAFTIKVVKAKK